MQTKICKAIENKTLVTPKTGDPFEMVAYSPSISLPDGVPPTIRPDENGEMWYWTPAPDAD